MELKLDSKFVSRNLRLAIREWYAWLSDKSSQHDHGAFCRSRRDLPELRKDGECS